MKRALIAFGFAAVVGFIAGDVSTAEAATPRPPTEFAQVQTLNGVPRRWTLPDGGQSILIAASGQACADLTGSNCAVLMFEPEMPVNVCVGPMKVNQANATSLNVWDGGCNTIDTDPNFGVPLQAWVPQYMTLEPTNNTICAAADAGAFRMPLWCMY